MKTSICIGIISSLKKKTWDREKGVGTSDKPLLVELLEVLLLNLELLLKTPLKAHPSVFVRITEMCQAKVSQYENCL